MRCLHALALPVTIAVSFLTFSCSDKKQAETESFYADPYPGVVSKKFYNLPVGAVRPEGWLKDTMVSLGEGITGHLHEYKSDRCWNKWDNRRAQTDPAWYYFEEQAYWADGIIQLAYILDDERLKAIADEWVDKTLSGQDPGGYMGCSPDNPYSSRGGIYVQSLLSLALMSYHSATGDTRIIPSLQRGFKSILNDCTPVIDSEGNLPIAWRGGSYGWPSASHIIYPLLWVYAQTGDPQMKELADLIFSAGQEPVEVRDGWPGRRSEIGVQNLLQEGNTLYGMHGVDATEVLRIPALYHLYSGDPDHLDASIQGIRKVDRYHGQAHGTPSSDEQFRLTGASIGSETCDQSTWSATKQTLFTITGNVRYADGIEKILFNAGPGSRKPDGKAVQYFSTPNQAACTRTSCEAPTWGLQRHSFNPDAVPDVGCCVGEACRLHPNFVKDAMWQASADLGLAATCYGPSTVTAKVSDAGKTVKIVEKTNYPFEEQIRFEIELQGATRFPLYVRIPGWCDEASVKINEESFAENPRPGKIVRIDRLWTDGDVVELSLPMQISFSTWNNGSVAVERGPLVYSLKIKQNWTKAGERFPGFPDWECRPGSPWNYALSLVTEQFESSQEFALIARKNAPHTYFSVSYPEVPKGSNPWEFPPIELTCKAKRIDGWKLRKNEATPDVPTSPVITANPEEEITLIPFGCAPIRITYFPVTKRAE